MTDERPILIVNETEWTSANVAEAEREGFDVKPSRWVKRRTAYVIQPELVYHSEFSIERMLEENEMSDSTSVADG